jgi:putative endonuclease
MDRKYCAYILKSLKNGKYYYGQTSDIDKRLILHNLGKIRSTKARRPFLLHYKEEFDSRSEAVKREYFFKSIDGYLWLKHSKII